MIRGFIWDIVYVIFKDKFLKLKISQSIGCEPYSPLFLKSFKSPHSVARVARCPSQVAQSS